MDQTPKSALTHLFCPECGELFSSDILQTYCQACPSPLLARYDLPSLRKYYSPPQVKDRPRGMWRWAELLPVRDPQYRLSLGEGDTPLLPAPRLAEHLGLSDLYIKDEAHNPTGTFKARGLAAAVSKAVELGSTAFVIPTAGNAGGALAAYAAFAGCDAHVYMPVDAPQINQYEVSATGTDLQLVAGLIHDAAHLAEIAASDNGWFNFSTFKEPYRVEGKKTMGLEIAEAFGWDLPEVIIYPTGGGTGLVGMWKAFSELEALGWIGHKRPRMVSVQAQGCAPIVRAFQEKQNHTDPWKEASTLASGLRVPKVFADRLIMRILYNSQGIAVAVSDREVLHHVDMLSRVEGIFAAPEGGATLAALAQLQETGWVQPHESVVLFNTGHGLKYL